MDVVEMVLGGRVNKGLVTLIQQAGGSAVGLCGKDSSIINARQMVEKDIGFVGDITSINKALIQDLVRDQYIPVVASVAADKNGQALNVNADIAAGEVRHPSCTRHSLLGRITEARVAGKSAAIYCTDTKSRYDMAQLPKDCFLDSAVASRHSEIVR